MSEPSSHPVPPELQVLLDLELTIKSLQSAVEQQRLEEVLAGISGMDSVSFFEDKIAIRYDPQKITQAEIASQIGSAGFAIAAADSAPPSPSVGSH